MNLCDIYHSKIDHLMTLYIPLLDQLSLSLSFSLFLSLFQRLKTLYILDNRLKKMKWKKRSVSEAYHHIFFWWLFSLSLSLSLSLTFFFSSRKQIICVLMTRVLHHLLDTKMRFVPPVSLSRMNGQLDVTGARRHIHIHIYIWIYGYDEWWRVRCRRKFSNRTPTRDDKKKDDFSKWGKRRMKKHKSNWTTKREENRSLFWFMSHHYDSKAINQTQHAYKH